MDSNGVNNNNNNPNNGKSDPELVAADSGGKSSNMDSNDVNNNNNPNNGKSDPELVAADSGGKSLNMDSNDVNNNNNPKNGKSDPELVAADSGGKSSNMDSNGVNNNPNNGKSDPELAAADSGGVENLRDILNFGIFWPFTNLRLQANICPYENMVGMIRSLNLQDDGIIMNQKIQYIENVFRQSILDETMLSDAIHYINDKALEDNEMPEKFALLFASHNFDRLEMKETKVRNVMLKTLEINFINASKFRENDKERLYNSITLLGEYYSRVRFADGSPISILGESLLELLSRELRDRTATDILDVKLAKCIFSQILLNGYNLRTRHKVGLTNLLNQIRCEIIQQADPAVRAILLMTMDIFYNQFRNTGNELAELYEKYYNQSDNADKTIQI